MYVLDLLLAGDAAVRAWLTTHHHPALDMLMVTLSIAGRAGAVWLAMTAVLVLLDRRRRRAAFRVVVALSLAYAMTDGVVKPLVARARPFESSVAIRVLDARPSTYSFPSGHAAASFAAAWTLTHAWPAGRVPIWTLALLVSFSRIYVGVHYPLDVVGGVVLGLACARASWWLVRQPELRSRAAD